MKIGTRAAGTPLRECSKGCKASRAGLLAQRNRHEIVVLITVARPRGSFTRFPILPARRGTRILKCTKSNFFGLIDRTLSCDRTECQICGLVGLLHCLTISRPVRCNAFGSSGTLEK